MPVEKQNRRLILFLLAFTILIGAAGYFQFKGAIYAPFGDASKKQAAQQIEQELSTIVMQDTDNDGLTDFDERFIYSTSAYIADTDSDAYSDKEEIDAGSNPLDKKSTPYNRAPDVQEDIGGRGGKISVGQASKDGEGESILETTFPAPEETEGLTQILKENLSGQEIRDLLIQSGIDKDIVDKLDDKTLKTLYNETIQEIGINPVK